MLVEDCGRRISSTPAFASVGVRLDQLPAEIIEHIAYFLARHDSVEARFRYAFLRGVLNLRLSCRTIAFKLDSFFKRSFETICIELSCKGLQRAVYIANASDLAFKVRCVRLSFNLVVPGEDEILENIAEFMSSDLTEYWWLILARKRTQAIERACSFISSFGLVYLSRAFSRFQNLSEIRLPLEDKQWEPLDQVDPVKALMDTILGITISALDIARRKIHILGFDDSFDIWLSLGASAIAWRNTLRKSRIFYGLTSLEISIDHSNRSHGPWGRHFHESFDSAHFPCLERLSLYADFCSRHGANFFNVPLYPCLRWPQTIRSLSIDGFCIQFQVGDPNSFRLPVRLDELSIRNCRFIYGDPLDYLTEYVTTSRLKKLYLSQIAIDFTRVSFEGFPYAKEGDVELYYAQRGEVADAAELVAEYVWIENNKYELEINSACDSMEEMLPKLRQYWKVQIGLSVESSSEFSFWWDPADVPDNPE
ncbi:uncharacterized protein PV09_03790 [Verruconis gallopava]|uniref:F-box domain-containing protein n=1 Tax=Verruconis gallopava TaxID=253628 RepID=A0A0D1YX09_9PEZI|nr:uncharacterized protein PV09_03790 [Verruconis gallopava]KIW05257.1 hypothetical protein PV09_03790 [Verruconis gallopava]